jgi:hypothetical protein
MLKHNILLHILVYHVHVYIYSEQKELIECLILELFLSKINTFLSNSGHINRKKASTFELIKERYSLNGRTNELFNKFNSYEILPIRRLGNQRFPCNSKGFFLLNCSSDLGNNYIAIVSKFRSCLIFYD